MTPTLEKQIAAVELTRTREQRLAETFTPTSDSHRVVTERAAALAAAAETLRRMQWRPIESAPRTSIEVWAKGWAPMPAYWLDGRGCWAIPFTDGAPLPFTPTHWRPVSVPLPPAPEDAR